MPLNGKKSFFGFLLVWFLLNLLQAGLTELDPDECYYWMYAKELCWGYFDHPPAIALLIKPGYVLFPNELGVRLGVVTLQIFSFIGIWFFLGKPEEKNRVLTLIALLAAMPVLHIFGFIATPDSPLLFFTVLYLLAYKKFLQKDNVGNAILLGICMSALLYSKYHGLLLILLTSFSHLALFRKKNFYLAGFLGILLFFPHLFWQYENDFPSFRYHLSGRDDVYKLKYSYEYLLNQLVIFSPFLFPLFIKVLVKTKIEEPVQKAFFFIIFGFWVFFFYTTFKGHVEPQWTAILSIPFILLSYHYCEKDPGFDWWLKRLALLSFCCLVVLRIFLLFPLLDRKSHFHFRDWVYEIDSASQNKPVIFENSYREASKFTFYSGRLAYTFTNSDYRKNQFDIWDWEKDLHNQQVMIVGQTTWECTDCEELRFGKRLRKIVSFPDSLQVAQKVKITFTKDNLFWRGGDSLSIPLTINNPYSHDVRLYSGDLPVSFEVLFMDELENTWTAPLTLTKEVKRLLPGDTLQTGATFVVPEELNGTFDFYLGVKTGSLPVNINSRKMQVKVE